MARAKLVGKLTSKRVDNSVNSFYFLKKFDINIQPRKPMVSIDIIWCPPINDWIKCNIDETASSSLILTADGGIFRDNQANHIISFCIFLGEGSPVLAEFMAEVLAIEKAKDMHWSKFRLETDCIFVAKAFSDSTLVQ
ncbi:uncharacterized protein LOC131618921 [Vicia villosa]|uniref:uncharacterized protein LOC131618921 n=1 Tax=Vicia villosa TaxID=3911 RepID=UPI00273B880C|nr:uncharacterized protein LOC131618921 [Vicia villosa]